MLGHALDTLRTLGHILQILDHNSKYWATLLHTGPNFQKLGYTSEYCL